MMTDHTYLASRPVPRPRAPKIAVLQQRMCTPVLLPCVQLPQPSSTPQRAPPWKVSLLSSIGVRVTPPPIQILGRGTRIVSSSVPTANQQIHSFTLPSIVAGTIPSDASLNAAAQVVRVPLVESLSEDSLRSFQKSEKVWSVEELFPLLVESPSESPEELQNDQSYKLHRPELPWTKNSSSLSTYSNLSSHVEKMDLTDFLSSVKVASNCSTSEHSIGESEYLSRSNYSAPTSFEGEIGDSNLLSGVALHTTEIISSDAYATVDMDPVDMSDACDVHSVEVTTEQESPSQTRSFLAFPCRPTGDDPMALLREEHNYCAGPEKEVDAETPAERFANETFMKKYEQLFDISIQVEENTSELITKLTDVKKALLRLKAERSYLAKRLEKHGDGFKEAYINIVNKNAAKEKEKQDRDAVASLMHSVPEGQRNGHLLKPREHKRGKQPPHQNRRATSLNRKRKERVILDSEIVEVRGKLQKRERQHHDPTMSHLIPPAALAQQRELEVKTKQALDAFEHRKHNFKNPFSAPQPSVPSILHACPSVDHMKYSPPASSATAAERSHPQAHLPPVYRVVVPKPTPIGRTASPGVFHDDKSALDRAIQSIL